MQNVPTLTPWTFLEHARMRAGYTPSEAACALEISLGHYCNVECGRDQFGSKTTIRAARLFNVDPVDLHLSRPPRRPRAGQKAAA